jgi:hypothetical protein
MSRRVTNGITTIAINAAMTIAEANTVIGATIAVMTVADTAKF